MQSHDMPERVSSTQSFLDATNIWWWIDSFTLSSIGSSWLCLQAEFSQDWSQSKLSQLWNMQCIVCGMSIFGNRLFQKVLHLSFCFWLVLKDSVITHPSNCFSSNSRDLHHLLWGLERCGDCSGRSLQRWIGQAQFQCSFANPCQWIGDIDLLKLNWSYVFVLMNSTQPISLMVFSREYNHHLTHSLLSKSEMNRLLIDWHWCLCWIVLCWSEIVFYGLGDDEWVNMDVDEWLSCHKFVKSSSLRDPLSIQVSLQLN